MKTFQSWFFKILWWLTFVVIVLAVIVLISRDLIVKQLAEQRIHAATGLEPEIGSVSFSVLEPTFTFENFRLYNPAEFGGTLFLDVPELHVEYDRAALRRHELHLTLMRVNLHELDVVRNAAGATNLTSIVNAIAPRQSGTGRTFVPLNGYKFTGIDVLNLSLGAAKFVDLKDPLRNRTVAISLQNLIYTNVTSSADLRSLSELLWRRGGATVGLPVNPPTREASPAPAPKTP
jgi:hypothetical protein